MIGKYSLAALCILLVAEVGFAQKLNHPLRAGNNASYLRPASPKKSPASVRVLAIMVQFQTDNDVLTSGNGQFDLSTAPQRIIDAPPRDSAYFADHLLFAKNYFQKSSKGNLTISSTVLSSVLTLSKQMKQYAPVNSNAPLGGLIAEAWGLADSAYPAFPFDQYDLFVIFHAGSGKDIDLKGSIGYDPTPYDIPSLYFSLQGLREIFGSAYAGIPLKNHPGVTIQNTVILPETENRTLPAATGGDFLYQLGINGLVVANVGSYLGLPDLFDTKTGSTAIGRFGLMDGQSIFSFFGLFPPEPSAWERIFLGWTSPIVVPSGSSNLRLPAISLYPAGDTVYRVPISAKEYFLVENRNRDVNKDGETLTIHWNGQQFQKNYAQDDDHFYAFNVDSIYGNVVDVDELDWSLPGAQGFYGGALIWHIDEEVIEKNFAANTINADSTHRGVNLEEADGSQDIGQTYGLLDSGSGSEDGSPIDFWFSKNNSPVYKNAFNESTNPNSLSNSLSRSHVALDQFSDAGPLMTLHASVGDSRIALLKTIKRRNIKLNQNDAPFFANVDGSSTGDLVYTAGDSIYVLKRDLTSLLRDSSGLFSPFGGRLQPAYSRNGSGLVCSRDSLVYVLSNADLNGDGFADSVSVGNVGSLISSPPASMAPTDVRNFVGDRSGRLDELSVLNPFPPVYAQPAHTPISSLSVMSSLDWTVLSDDSLISSQGGVKKVGSRNVLAFGNAKFTFATSASNMAGVSTVVLFANNSFSVLDAATLAGEENYRVDANVTGSFALADVNGDGQIDILIGTDAGLFAYSKNGVLLDHFPLKTSDAGKVVGSPIVVRLLGSSSVGILFGSSNGQVCGYDAGGKMIDGFPLQTGGMVSSLAYSGSLLAAASTDSAIYIWQLTNILDSTNVAWGGFLADVYHSNYVESAPTVAARSTDLLPASSAYNWPNPVYDKMTHIRYYLGMQAAVTIKIYNMAGELVQQLSGPGVANLDNEVQWDVSKVQSGVYFAQIKANATGAEKSVVVKIAVVK